MVYSFFIVRIFLFDGVWILADIPNSMLIDTKITEFFKMVKMIFVFTAKDGVNKVL